MQRLYFERDHLMSDVLERVRKIVIEHLDADPEKVTEKASFIDGRGGGGPDYEGSFDPDQTLSTRDQRRVDDFILYAIAAADEAVKDSGWQPGEDDREGRERTGVMIGSGIGGLATIERTSIEMH